MARSSIEEIISFAIDKERESIAFYEDLACRARDPVMKDAILSMADEERKHEKLLTNLTPKKIQFVRETDRPDLKLSDYLVETSFSEDSTFQELLVVGMKREERSYALYSDLEQRAPDDATRKLFTFLKGEELKHKARLEKEYEERVFHDN